MSRPFKHSHFYEMYFDLLLHILPSQVSGIRFAFDPDQPGGQRVLKETVMVHDNIPINLEHVSCTISCNLIPKVDLSVKTIDM